MERPITDCIVADVAFVAEMVYLWWRFRRRCLPEVGSALSSRCEAVRTKMLILIDTGGGLVRVNWTMRI